MPETNAAWRRSNIGFLLFSATDRFVREKLALVHADGFRELTDAQLTLLLSIDPEGTRPTIIAARANLTKPSVVELIDRAERSGMVARRADPHDSRARIVAFTPLGKQALTAICGAVASAEAQFTGTAGAELALQFRSVLGPYAAETALDDTERTAGWHSGNIGRVLAMAARRFVREVLAIVHEGGHRDIGETLLSLIRNLDLGGTRLTDLATRAHMTKQSMRELVDRAEAMGLVARVPDPADKRAKNIRFTPAGRTMLEAMRGGVEIAEARLVSRLGQPLVADIRSALVAYIAEGGEGRHHPRMPLAGNSRAA